MHYLFLDTNIYLDMVIWRHDSVPPETLEYLLFVLKNPDVRLILPDIVVSEFDRNVKQVFEQCKQRLNMAHEYLSAVIFPRIEEVNAFRADQKDMLQRLAKWKDRIKNGAYDYIERFQQISSGPNVIKVTTWSAILEGIIRRRLFKRAPCHHDGKVCDADAALIEILLRLPEIVHPETIDTVTFISRNTKDFTDGKNKRAFHPDILEDLQKVGLADKVTFSPVAYETLKNKFRVEVAAEVVEQEKQNVEAISQSPDIRRRHGMFRLQNMFFHPVELTSQLQLWNLEEIERMTQFYQTFYQPFYNQLQFTYLEPMQKTVEYYETMQKIAENSERLRKLAEPSEPLRKALESMERMQSIAESSFRKVQGIESDLPDSPSPSGPEDRPTKTKPR